MGNEVANITGLSRRVLDALKEAERMPTHPAKSTTTEHSTVKLISTQPIYRENAQISDVKHEPGARLAHKLR